MDKSAFVRVSDMRRTRTLVRPPPRPAARDVRAAKAGRQNDSPDVDYQTLRRQKTRGEQARAQTEARPLGDHRYEELVSCRRNPPNPPQSQRTHDLPERNCCSNETSARSLKPNSMGIHRIISVFRPVQGAACDPMQAFNTSENGLS